MFIFHIVLSGPITSVRQGDGMRFGLLARSASGKSMRQAGHSEVGRAWTTHSRSPMACSRGGLVHFIPRSLLVVGTSFVAMPVVGHLNAHCRIMLYVTHGCHGWGE